MGTASLVCSCLGRLSSHLDLLSAGVSAGRYPLMFRGESCPWKSHFVSAKKGHCGLTAGASTWSFPDTAELALLSCILEWLNWKIGILSKTSAVAEGFCFPLLSYLVKLNILCKYVWKNRSIPFAEFCWTNRAVLVFLRTKYQPDLLFICDMLICICSDLLPKWKSRNWIGFNYGLI